MGSLCLDYFWIAMASAIRSSGPGIMARVKHQYESNGFYGIGVLHSEIEANIGTLWRSAYILGASYIFTIDHKYKKQSTDVTQAWTKIPLFHYEDFDHFKEQLPYATQLVGVELTEDSIPLVDFEHPSRAAYLLGCESIGLPDKVLERCHSVISLPGNFSLNVAVTGSIVACDRVQKTGSRVPSRGDG